MINELYAMKYCKDDITKIENYDKAINDLSQTWVIHHRDEIKILPSGINVVRSKEDLIEAGRYYQCPAIELIFLTKSEHRRLHNMNRSDDTRRKMSEARKGKRHSDEARRKMSEARKGKQPMKGKHHSDETRRKISEAKKGKTFSDDTRRKMSEVRKDLTWKVIDGKRVWLSKEVV